MAHKALIGGTAYSTKGGKCRVSGTNYSLKKGRALVGGTVYNINFVTTISFIMGYTTYYAVDGMTWSQWITSGYNTYDSANREMLIENNRVCWIDYKQEEQGYVIDGDTNYVVYASDTIVSNRKYYMS